MPAGKVIEVYRFARRKARNGKPRPSASESLNGEISTHEGNPLTHFRADIYNHRADSGSNPLPFLRSLVPLCWFRNRAVGGEVPT